jgi:hypothetical protein
MAKVTLVFAVLFIALGLTGFIGTGSQHPTALIPAALGLLLGIFGALSFRPMRPPQALHAHQRHARPARFSGHGHGLDPVVSDARRRPRQNRLRLNPKPRSITSVLNAHAAALQRSGQRLISELRKPRQVQQHVGRLSVAYYDENRTGTLVARIMTDVEGVRNLIGTGLVDFRRRHAHRRPYRLLYLCI